MVGIKNTAIGLAAAVGMMQMAPAPIAIPIEIGAAIAGGATAGAIGGAATLCSRYCPGPKAVRGAKFVNMMARDLPPGVSQHSIDECKDQIKDQFNKNHKSVEISDVDEKTINVANVPAACMNLATVLTGDPAQSGGPVPIPQGSDSLHYTNISADDRKQLAKALKA
ncbi:hypothetical protein PWT90_03833 [Aphanocladium album]|nr:hypothetical protein PWT90_03833 [Aphanocladium album]